MYVRPATKRSAISLFLFFISSIFFNCFAIVPALPQSLRLAVLVVMTVQLWRWRRRLRTAWFILGTQSWSLPLFTLCFTLPLTLICVLNEHERNCHFCFCMLFVSPTGLLVYFVEQQVTLPNIFTSCFSPSLLPLGFVISWVRIYELRSSLCHFFCSIHFYRFFFLVFSFVFFFYTPKKVLPCWRCVLHHSPITFRN